MFFILGIPRSGTTLVERILNKHSVVGVCPENSLFDNLKKFGATTEFNSPWQYQTCLKESLTWFKTFNDPAYDFLSEYIRQNPTYLGSTIELLCELRRGYLRVKNKEKLGFKSPELLNQIEYLEGQFPKATYIILIRNPLDSICSVARTKSEYFRGNAYSDKSLLRTAMIMKRLLHNARRFVQRTECKFLVVPYEKLVQDPVLWVNRLCDTLDIAFEEQMLGVENDAYINKSANASHMEYLHQNLTKPIKAYNVKSYAKELNPSQITLIHRFLKESFVGFNIESPVGEGSMSWYQKYLLVRANLLYAIRWEQRSLWWTTQKLKIKRFVNRK